MRRLKASQLQRWKELDDITAIGTLDVVVCWVEVCSGEQTALYFDVQLRGALQMVFNVFNLSLHRLGSLVRTCV